MPTEEDVRNQMMQQKQMELALKTAMYKILDAKARERLNNLKFIKPEIATQLEMYLYQAFQAGQIKGVITEEQIVMILKKISEKRDIKITRK